MKEKILVYYGQEFDDLILRHEGEPFYYYFVFSDISRGESGDYAYFREPWDKECESECVLLGEL